MWFFKPLSEEMMEIQSSHFLNFFDLNRILLKIIKSGDQPLFSGGLPS